MDKTAEEIKDEFIYEHIHRFGENNLFRASLDHFREHGKPTGSFRASLHDMLEEYASPLKKKIEELEANEKWIYDEKPQILEDGESELVLCAGNKGIHQ